MLTKNNRYNRTLWLILLFLVGCSPITQIPSLTPAIHPFTPSSLQITQTVTPTFLATTDAIFPTSTPAATKTEFPSPTKTPRLPTATRFIYVTSTPANTLVPEAIETIQPLMKDPMNCDAPCFWGFIPGKLQMDEVRKLFSQLGFTPFEGTDSGRDFYTIDFRPYYGDNSSVTFFTANNFIENIIVDPHIVKQKEGGPRDWIAYSPETLIKKYGKPSRMAFGVDLGQVNITINMILYFDQIDLITLYSGYDDTLRLCPFTYPFDHVRLWMGSLPPDRPSFETVSLEKATGLTIDQFTQLMLGNPQKACFTLNVDVLQ